MFNVLIINNYKLHYTLFDNFQFIIGITMLSGKAEGLDPVKP